MYNITIGAVHPSVICVELSNLLPSLHSLRELLQTEYVEEGLQEFIEEFARTDEVLPTDKTLGFVVVNSNKRMVSFSFSSVDPQTKTELLDAGQRFQDIGYAADIDIP